MGAALIELAPLSPKTAACRILGISRATLHRRENPKPAETEKAPAQRVPHPAALSGEEREQVLDVLDSDRFADKSPAQAWAVLLDEGCYYCSIRTMYRILESRNEVRERRAQAARPPRVRPELVATGPDQVWTWDITKLKSAWKGLCFDLYVVLDIFSRKAIRWEVHVTETGDLAKAFIENAVIANGGARPDYIHADNGTSMTSKPVSQLLSDLHITDSHSRPHVSNDNPYSEAQLPGSGQGSHLPAPTDPDVNLSAHPARAVQSFGQYRSDQCANSRGAISLTSFSHSRALLSLRSSRLYFRRAQRIRWRSMRSQSGITLLG
jgi:putative transposase